MLLHPGLKHQVLSRQFQDSTIKKQFASCYNIIWAIFYQVRILRSALRKKDWTLFGLLVVFRETVFAQKSKTTFLSRRLNYSTTPIFFSFKVFGSQIVSIYLYILGKKREAEQLQSYIFILSFFVNISFIRTLGPKIYLSPVLYFFQTWRCSFSLN